MHELSWKSRYEIGNPLVDREHKHLFDIAVEAFKPVLPEERKSKIRETIMELNEYMKVHFKHEESLMRTLEYPNLVEHMQIHKQIIHNIQTMITSLSTTPLKEFEKNLAFFIDSALVGHILEEDAKIQKFYEAKKGQRHVIRWDSDLSIGEETIDDEHKFLFEVANKAFVLSQNGANKAELKEIILSLLSYFESHFEHEERYMEEIEYPYLKKHQEIHKSIIHKTNEFIKEMVHMDTKTFEVELALFIERFVVQHILHEDKKIKNFLMNNEMVVNLEDFKK